MVDEEKSNRKIKDMKGYDEEVNKGSQYGMRNNPRAGTKEWPWTVASKFCDIPPDVYKELVIEAKSAEYEPYFAFNFGYVDHPWAHEIVEKYEEIYGCLYLKVDGGSDILPHCDPVRRSSIIAPLCTEEETYVPLEIYADETIYTIGKSEAGGAYAWNCRLPHGVFNRYNKDRVNLQWNLSIPYVDFYRKYIASGKFGSLQFYE